MFKDVKGTGLSSWKTFDKLVAVAVCFCILKKPNAWSIFKKREPSSEEDGFYSKFRVWKGTPFLRAIFRHEIQGAWGQPARVYQRKSHLTNLTIFYYEMSGFVNEVKAVLDSRKTFNTVSNSILVAEPRRDGLCGVTLMLLKNWPHTWAKRATVNCCKPSWNLVVNVILQELIWCCSCSFLLIFIELSDIFIKDQDNHTDEPQEVQQREMPNPLAKNNPMHYYRLEPTKSKQICRSSWGILESVSLNISQQCNLAIIQAACALHYKGRA